jgi:uncharacterized protein with FMN-binding domain
MLRKLSGGREMKQLKRYGTLFALCLMVCMSGIAAVSCVLPKPLVIEMEGIDLSKMPDGTWQGVCENGIVKAVVEVTVSGHAITGIDLREHREGKGESAEAITAEVLAAQSLDVDVISGATASSQTILKAIEDALRKGMNGANI